MCNKAPYSTSNRGSPYAMESCVITVHAWNTVPLATGYSINTRRGFTVNPDAKAKESKNKIDIILHKGGVPSSANDAQAQIFLLSGG
jgi:hypothetical protein